MLILSRILCIGDVHGCSNTLKELLYNQIKITKNDKLIFVGDYIDRGPDSKGVIDVILYLQKQNYDLTCLLGNHEELFMESLKDHEIYSHWFKYCGGCETLRSFNIQIFSELDEEYKYFFKTLLYFKIIPQTCIIVHAGLNFSNSDLFEDKYSMIWARDTKIDFSKFKDRYIIHGHTPQSLNITENQIKNISENKIVNIDNGCVYKDDSSLGILTAIDLNTKEIYRQKNVDAY